MKHEQFNAIHVAQAPIFPTRVKTVPRHEYTWLKYGNDLIELAVALMKNKSFGNSTGEDILAGQFIQDFSSFFGLQLKWVESRISQKRNQKTTARFLHQLVAAYENSLEL